MVATCGKRADHGGSISSGIALSAVPRNSESGWHVNPVRKGLIEKPEQWRWSSYNNFSLDKSIVAACPIQIDYVQLSRLRLLLGFNRGYALPASTHPNNHHTNPG